MHIPFIDLKTINAQFKADEAILRVLRSGNYLRSVEVEAFEHEFAAFSGVAHCVGLANGLDALRLTLRAWISLGALTAGDEVLVPANSFVASALAVTESGLSVGFVDADPTTFNVTAAAIENAITTRTRAVMPVHLYGQLSDIEAIRTLCQSKRLLMLEDAAQAHGAQTATGRAGSFGDAGAFSFYPTKNLGALGDAGCMVTDDAALASRVRALGNYGSHTKYRHEFFGTNSRIDELHAAVLRLKLRQLDQDDERRRHVARRYLDEIRSPGVGIPAEPADPRSHVWHLFVVTTPHRESLVAHLNARNIQTIVHYPCAIHQQPVYIASTGTFRLPISERLQHEVLSLPISPVMEGSQVDYVIEAMNEWTGR